MQASCTGVGCFNPSCRHCSTSHDDSWSSANPAMLRPGAESTLMSTSGALILRQVHATSSSANSSLGRFFGVFCKKPSYLLTVPEQQFPGGFASRGFTFSTTDCRGRTVSHISCGGTLLPVYVSQEEDCVQGWRHGSSSSRCGLWRLRRCRRAVRREERFLYRQLPAVHQRGAASEGGWRAGLLPARAATLGGRGFSYSEGFF